MNDFRSWIRQGSGVSRWGPAISQGLRSLGDIGYGRVGRAELRGISRSRRCLSGLRTHWFAIPRAHARGYWLLPLSGLTSAKYVLSSLLLLLFLPAALVRAELTFEPSWELPDYAKVRGQIVGWIEQEDFENGLAEEAYALWPSVDLRGTEGPELLDRVVETFALNDERAQALVEACNANLKFPVPPDGNWLGDPALTPLKRENLQLYYARWLAQHGHYDEAAVILAELAPADVVDPAGLLFYRAVAFQQLVEPEDSRSALVQLLEREEELPERFQQVAKLLQRDLAGLQDESLDHIARRMNDVRRRLDIGRAGKQVQVVEKGVIDSLDRIIKKLEDEQQQQQSSSSGGSQGSKPMQDSMLPSMKAPMQVDQRDIGSESGWGDLPPKEREQALQQIGREFPAHYRELIEQYFRELADESNASPSN